MQQEGQAAGSPLIAMAESPGHFYAGLSNGDYVFSAEHANSWTQQDFNLRGIERPFVILTQ